MMKKRLFVFSLVLLLAACVPVPFTPTPTATLSPTATTTATATAMAAASATASATVTPRDRPRILLFIGDGMGAEHRKAGQYAAVGEASPLVMDSLPVFGWMVTDSFDGAPPDSAAAATALGTGVRTDIDVVGMDVEGNALETILEIAQERGMSVGLVSTKFITDATTAAFAAHVLQSGMRAQIAAQFLEHRVDVLLGGGEDDFLPAGESGCYPAPGNRADGRDLIAEAQAEGYTYVCDAASFTALDPAVDTHVLGLFADENMERPYAPSLAAMTETAIAILSQNPNGYFLMVEGAMIDIASHFHESQHVIDDVNGFDEAVAVGVAAAEADENTLLIVTADHETGGLVVNTEPTGVSNEEGPFRTPNGEDFYLSWHSGDHTYTHVPVTALGAGAEALRGIHNNTLVFEVMLGFLGVER